MGGGLRCQRGPCSSETRPQVHLPESQALQCPCQLLLSGALSSLRDREQKGTTVWPVPRPSLCNVLARMRRELGEKLAKHSRSLVSGSVQAVPLPRVTRMARAQSLGHLGLPGCGQRLCACRSRRLVFKGEATLPRAMRAGPYREVGLGATTGVGGQARGTVSVPKAEAGKEPDSTGVRTRLGKHPPHRQPHSRKEADNPEGEKSRQGYFEKHRFWVNHWGPGRAPEALPMVDAATGRPGGAGTLSTPAGQAFSGRRDGERGAPHGFLSPPTALGVGAGSEDSFYLSSCAPSKAC